MTRSHEPQSSLTANNPHAGAMVAARPSGFSQGTPSKGASTQGRAVAAMRIGQHVIAVLLTVVAVIRALTDGTQAVLAVSSGMLFLVWYFAGVRLPAINRNAKKSQVWLLVLALVWVACVVVSAEFVWLAFLLWLLAGHLFRWRASIVFSLVVFAVVVLAPVMHHGTTSYANVFGPLIGGIFALAISRGYLELLKDAREREALVAALERTQHDLLDLQDELALSQHQAGAISERTRISRDIHDTVAQSLTSIRMLALAETAKSDSTPLQTQQTLAQIEEISRESIADVRRIVAALAPGELEDKALGEALQRIVDRFRAETGLEAHLTIDATLPALSTEYNVALLRIAQSALANVRLHAKASRVVVSLMDSDDAVRLDILDDGQGMDVSTLQRATGDADSSFGLGFIRARLRELGGGLDLESTPGEGTVLSAHVPLRKDF